MTARELINAIEDLAVLDPTVLDHEVLILGDWHALSVISAEHQREEPLTFSNGDPYRMSRYVVIPV